MNFKYNKKINKRYGKFLVFSKEAFGIKFPNKISITKLDEKTAEKKIPEFFGLWNRDKELRKNILKIYRYKLPKTLNCYIVTAKTSGYALKKKSILLSMHTPIDKVPMVIIHEFSHIAFLEEWNDICKKMGCSENKIQDLKEALTVINNLEYDGINDRGYTIHQKLRQTIKEMWQNDSSLLDILAKKVVN